jgi:NAD+ synthase (glutamine-hydrolysing)
MSLLSAQAHVGVATMNQTVGDWSGNVARCLEVIRAAKAKGVRLLLLPEMCLSGYSLGDRLQRQGTLSRSWDAMTQVALHTTGIAVAVGLPVLFEGVIFNAMAVLVDGKLVGIVAKENLATGDVEYENRYFQSWQHGRCVDFATPAGEVVPIGTQLFEIPGIGRVAFEICEDAWKGIRPGSTFALAGAEIVLNPSASWFTIGKHRVRRRMVEQISQEDHCVYLYGSLLGCDATRLVFDGSAFICSNGKVIQEARRFVFTHDWELIDAVVDLTEIRQVRMEEGSWREQHLRMHFGAYGQLPHVTSVPHAFLPTATLPPPTPPYWLPSPTRHTDPSLAYLEAPPLSMRPITDQDLNHLELELALCLALRDYQRKSRIPAFCLALSGGRDSAMVALLVQRMFRYSHPTLSPSALRALIHDQFVCAYMGTENSGDLTRAAAKAVADDLGARFFDGHIQASLAAVQANVSAMTHTEMRWDNPAHDIPLQNIQARLRGLLIWTIANLNNALLLVTSNKSEAAVGYTTMDGDTSGGIAPIADVPKSLVSLYLSWAQRFHDLDGLKPILALQASAELRPLDQAQTDEDDLMPFFVLDQLMYAFVQQGLDPLDILQRLWPTMHDHYHGDLAAFAAHIRKFTRMFCFAQWKRERFAISFRVTAFDLDPKTGYRFPPVQAPFTEELAAMDAFVSQSTYDHIDH